MEEIKVTMSTDEQYLRTLADGCYKVKDPYARLQRFDRELESCGADDQVRRGLLEAIVRSVMSSTDPSEKNLTTLEGLWTLCQEYPGKIAINAFANMLHPTSQSALEPGDASNLRVPRQKLKLDGLQREE